MSKNDNDRSKIREIGEFGFISRLKDQIGTDGPGVVLGIGDDAAVLEVTSGELLLATNDVQIENVHFTLEHFTPDQIGRRAAAQNLSDIAAMGGRPTFALVSLSTAGSLETGFLEKIYEGLADELRRYGAVIVGGNTAESPGGLALHVTLLGTVSADRLLRRDTARVGDVLCVTGTLGSARAGLALLGNTSIELPETARDAALRAHRTPLPRVAEGAYLAGTGLVSSAIDISDGLVGDAEHLARQSGVVASIELESIPVGDEVKLLSDLLETDPFEFAAAGGEDFELLFTVRPADFDRVRRGLARETGTRMTAIGSIEGPGNDLRLVREGRAMNLAVSGFRHFTDEKSQR